MKRLSSVVLWGALLLSVFLAQGQEQTALHPRRDTIPPAAQHIGLFLSGHMIAEIYADDVIKSTNGYFSFYREQSLVFVLKPESGLIWKPLISKEDDEKTWPAGR